MKTTTSRKAGALKWVAVAVSLCATSLAQAATVWDESVNGDFSNNRLAPTLISLLPGSNDLHGFTGNSGSGVDRDYFTFTLAPNLMLTALTLLPDTNVSGGVSFIALQAGPQITALPDGTGAEALLAYSHYSNDQIGQNLLLFLGLSGGLPSGTYSFWVQETGGGASYGLDFEVTAVPLPATAWLLISGLAGVAAWRRKGRAQTAG